MDYTRERMIVMLDSFVVAPPHPEKEESSCTAYSPAAKEISARLNTFVLDACVCAGNDGWYYMTGTVEESCEEQSPQGFPLWRSQDLTEWISLGQIGADVLDRGACGPRIHCISGVYYVTYGLEEGGTALLRSKEPLADGHYERIGCITEEGGGASMFKDDDGAVYWITGEGSIARMDDELLRLAEPLRKLEVTPYQIQGRMDVPSLTGNTRIGSRGACIVKQDGLYLLFAGEVTNRMGSLSEDTFAAVSESLLGPYSRRYLVIPHGGPASFFIHGQTGRLHAAFSGSGDYSPVLGKPAIIEMKGQGTGFVRPDETFLLEKGPVACLQPSSDFLIRDPHITCSPDGYYYLTGTSNQPHDDFWYGNDELHVWRSLNLNDWEHVGKVWDLHLDGTWQNAIREKPCLWAPEIYFLKETFWITYSLKGGSTGLLKSITGEASGPYVDMGRVTNRHIDSSLFQDDDGQIYYVWQDGWIAKMSEDMSGFAEEPRKLLTIDGETVGYEGAFIVKHKGKYILGAAEWNGDKRVDGTYDLMASVSDRLFGPYSSRAVAVPHGGHGTMFISKEGELMSTLFGNDRTAPFRTKLGIVKLALRSDALNVRIYPVNEDVRDEET